MERSGQAPTRTAPDAPRSAAVAVVSSRTDPPEPKPAAADRLGSTRMYDFFGYF